MILITGASGTVGSAVLAEVAGRGLPHRALYRSAAEAAKAPAGTEAVLGDFADKASLAPALREVRSVFLVCSPIPQLVELETNVIEVAEAAGVERIVLSSALGAGDYPKSFPSWHRKVEERLKAMRTEYVILRPNSFMQNVVAFYAPSVRAQGASFAAMGEARIAYVDVRDVAAVTAAVLGGGHDGATYELNGPEALSCAEVASKISKHAGVLARFVDIPVEEQRRAMLAQGMPDWQVTALLDLQAYYTGGRGGSGDGTTERVLGRTARTMDALLEEQAGAFRGG
jgi:uncharacterized protein YbjT (DUF2867 family)